MTRIEIVRNATCEKIHEFSKGLEIIPLPNEIIVIDKAKYQVVTRWHYPNESKIVIKVVKF